MTANYDYQIESNFVSALTASKDLDEMNQLDAEFDHHLASMKKYILDLKDRKSKQLCAVWIKKLCDVNGNENVASRQIRNAYSARLLDMLSNYEASYSNLLFPFDEKPSHGPLKPLDELEPRHCMKNTATTNNNKNNQPHNADNASDDNYFFDSQCDNNSNLNQEILYQYSQHNKTRHKEDKKNSSEYYLKNIEARFKEEKLNIQQQHSNEIQKLLDRKNQELDSMKQSISKKKKEYEDNIETLIRKMQHVKNESNLDREKYEKQISDLKQKLDCSLDKKQIESEKKLNDLVNKHDKEMLDLQKQHAKTFQDLVDETNARLKRVEQEYNEQLSINDKVILELENKTQLLKNEIEKNIHVISLMEKQVNEKDASVKSLEKKLHDSQSKSASVESDLAKLKEYHKKELHELNKKLESIAASKNREYETAMKRINHLKDEAKSSKNEYEKTIEKLNRTIKEKETALNNANSSLKQQKVKAELALSELKKEIESKSHRMYEEMKDQINKCESDLEKSKQLREKQAKEFQKQIEDLKKTHQYEIEQLGKETLRLKEEFERGKQKLLRDHECMCDKLQSQMNQQLVDANHSNKIKLDDLNKIRSQLELKIVQLEQELVDANALRKQQIVELGLLRDDEKSRLNRSFEKEIESLKFAYENEAKCLKQKLKDQRDDLENQIRTLLKQSDERCRKLSERVSESEHSVKMLDCENRKLRECLEREKSEFCTKLDEEKQSIKKFFQNQLNSLENDLEIEACKNKSLEKKLKSTNSEYEHYITNLKMQYEEKLKGNMPLSLKRDLEDTIASLKAQVDSLQKRTILLQSELDDRNQLVNSSTCSASL